MSYRIEQTPEFERDIARLDPETSRRIVAKIQWLITLKRFQVR